MDNQRIESVLIIKPSSFGDIIHALPVASAIKAAMPEVAVDWVVSDDFKGLLEGNPNVRRVIVFDRHLLKKQGCAGRFMSFVKELRSERYDAVIDLQGLLRSGMMAAACRTGRRIGFADAREGSTVFYTEKVAIPKTKVHAIEHYLSSLERLGIEPSGGGAVNFNITLSEKDVSEAVNLLMELGIDDGEPFVVIAPSARWNTKIWPAERFVKLANMLLESEGVRSILVGTANDERLLDGCTELLEGGNKLAFGRTSMKGLGALLKKACLMVGQDSGPMHMASALGTPTLALFGPSDPSWSAPYGNIHKVASANVNCSPCFRTECPDMRCMKELSLDAVYGLAKEMIRG